MLRVGDSGRGRHGIADTLFNQGRAIGGPTKPKALAFPGGGERKREKVKKDAFGRHSSQRASIMISDSTS